ncbi:MAG TPA: TlyA family RNA methyltransferase [Anaerolineales bacterium]|nr:TlyA family RNA methyltransferase [Anaerolineales bacterium]
MVKTRLDLLLVARGLAESRALAQRLVMAGQVRVDGQVALKPAVQVAEEALVSVEQGPRFVSRGGEKLEAALAGFEVPSAGRVCADVGASTGGFTDCLLQHGAARVYAIDVGQGILDWKLRQDPRVVVMEGTNARYVENLPEPVSLVTVDASFISLKILLPVIAGWFSSAAGEERGEVLALVKPQFEAGRNEVKRGKGVIRDAAVHRQVLLDVLAFAQAHGFEVGGLLRSPLTGPKGNTEFLARLYWPGKEPVDATTLVNEVLPAEVEK